MLNEKSRFYGKTKLITLEELVDTFSSEKFDYIKIALLFGSRATDEFYERSDYDIVDLSNITLEMKSSIKKL